MTQLFHLQGRSRATLGIAGRLFTALAVLAGLSFANSPRGRADFDDTPALRTTSASDGTSDIEIQVDDSEWTDTVLLVDDDNVSTVVDPINPAFSRDAQYSYRLYLQGLRNIGFTSTPLVDCPVALVAGEINLWDTNNCAASPSGALLAKADLVVWYTGQNGPPLLSSTLSAGEVSDLTTYLGGGGDLYLESHGYLAETDTCLGAFPYTTPVPSPGCISPADAAFINDYLGIDELNIFSRSLGQTRLLTYDPVTGDLIGDASEPLSIQTRRTASYRETLVTDVSIAPAANAILEDNDADFGGTLAAGSHFAATRTNDGTARVVFTPLYLENQFNRPDPDNFRTFFERSVRYLSDAPSVSVSNPRTGDSTTADLANSGLGVATGSVDPASVNAAAGDQLVTTYTQSSPVASDVTSTTTIVDPTPVSFTDSGGAPYTTLPVPGSFYVQVNDPDQDTTAAADTFALTLTSNLGDSELVSVTETGLTTGVFRSTVIVTDLSDTTANNGTLGVADGGTVSTTYDFLGNEQTKTFTQSAWEGGETNTTTSVDTTGFDELDDQTAINASEQGYFVIDDPDDLQTDWVKNNFAPNVNPQITPFTGIAPARFDSEQTFASSVVREPSSGDYYMWYTGENSAFEQRIGLALSTANSTAPVGREFTKYPDNTSYVPVIDIDDAPAGSWWECGASSPTVTINSANAFGIAGHFIMFFAGTDCGGTLSRIGRATSADGISWTVEADPISETVPGAPLEAPFNAGGDFNPSIIYNPAFALNPYLLWFDNATLIQHTHSLTGAAGTWTAPTTALNVSATGNEWDDVSVTAPSVVFLLSQDLYIMYYEGTGTACGDPNLFVPAIGRAERGNPVLAFAKPVAPAEQAGVCGEKDGGIPGPPDPPTYENIVLRPPETFGTWESVTSNPMLLADTTDGIDRLWYDAPTESGREIGLAWNMEADPDGTLHSNPIDTNSAGLTTVGYGPLRLTRLGHVIHNMSARTSDTLDDLLFDPAPGVAYPAGSPFLVNGALLGDFTGVTDGERYLQYRSELEQDTNPGMEPFETPPANLVFSDAVEEISLDVYQRENLSQTLNVTAELAATDAVVRITDATYTLDPTEMQVSYDLTSGLEESTKQVVDPNGGALLPGDRLDYTITVTSTAPAQLTNVTVYDEIPLGTDYLADTIFGTGADDSGEPSLIWHLGTLDPGEKEQIGFSAIVRDDIGQGSEILNQAFINSDQTGVVPTENPTTPVRHDPTIITVGARLLTVLVLAALLALATMLVRARIKKNRRLRLKGTSIGLLSILTLPYILVGLLGVGLGVVRPVQAQVSGNNLYFEVQDGDQNENPSVVDTVVAEVTTTSGDVESVTLTETDQSTGVFRSSRRIVLDQEQLQDNGLLEVEPGDTLTLSYVDEFNTGGSPRTVTDSVTIVSQTGDRFTISVVALTPRLLPGGGLEADILATPRDVFGRPAPDGTPVTFTSSVGQVTPSVDQTTKGVAQTLFGSSTIVNPSIVTATVSSPQGETDQGSVSLTTNVTTTSTSTTTNVPVTQINNVAIPGPNNQVNNATNAPPQNTVGNQVNAPSGQPTEPGPNLGRTIADWFRGPTWDRVQNVTERAVNPISIGVVAVNLALAAAVTSWYPLLLRIFLEPAQILFRRRRRPWGVVYNSLTKQPVDLAIVRLLRDGSLIRTTVTDRFGRFNFLVDPGTYRLIVTKPGFNYPSLLLKGLHQDEQFSDLYFGSDLVIQDERSINLSVPLDPPDATSSARVAVRRYFKKLVHAAVSYTGLMVGLLALIIVHTWLSAMLFVLHVLVFMLFRRIARGRHAPRWGNTFDRISGKVLPHSVIRIYDAKYNRVLEQQVSDRNGRFGFLVGKSSYFLDAVKSGYAFPAEKKAKPRDYIGGVIVKQEPEASVAVDIPLDPHTGGSGARPPLNPAAPKGPMPPPAPTI